MAQTPQTFLNQALADVDIPEEVSFVLPEELEAAADELALNEFLREFESQDEPLQIVGMFPVDEDR